MCGDEWVFGLQAVQTNTKAASETIANTLSAPAVVVRPSVSGDEWTERFVRWTVPRCPPSMPSQRLSGQTQEHKERANRVASEFLHSALFMLSFPNFSVGGPLIISLFFISNQFSAAGDSVKFWDPPIFVFARGIGLI